MFRDALNEHAAWGSSQYPYDHATGCGRCMTQHALGCSKHKDLVVAVRGLMTSSKASPIASTSLFGRWKFGRALLKIKPEILKLREQFNHLYDWSALKLEQFDGRDGYVMVSFDLTGARVTFVPAEQVEPEVPEDEPEVEPDEELVGV